MRFILLDRITSFIPGRSGTAIKNVSLSEDFFEDHFPLAPLMPGVLILEGMAQLAGLVLEAGCAQTMGRKTKPLLSIIESAKFRARSRPGDCLEYRAEVESSNDVGGKVSVTAQVNGSVIASCRLVFTFHDFQNERQEQKQAAIVAQLMKGIGSHGNR